MDICNHCGNEQRFFGNCCVSCFVYLEAKASLAGELASALQWILEECNDQNLAYHISPLYHSKAEDALAKWKAAKKG